MKATNKIGFNNLTLKKKCLSANIIDVTTTQLTTVTIRRFDVISKRDSFTLFNRNVNIVKPLRLL